MVEVVHDIFINLLAVFNIFYLLEILKFNAQHRFLQLCFKTLKLAI